MPPIPQQPPSPPFAAVIPSHPRALHSESEVPGTKISDVNQSWSSKDPRNSCKLVLPDGPA